MPDSGEARIHAIATDLREAIGHSAKLVSLVEELDEDAPDVAAKIRALASNGKKLTLFADELDARAADWAKTLVKKAPAPQAKTSQGPTHPPAPPASPPAKKQ